MIDFDDDEPFDYGEEDRPSYFEGDTGRLTLDQRKVINALLKQPYLWADRNPSEWEVLLAGERAIRSFLNDLFLQLHVDRTYEVAFKRQVVPEGGGRFPTLLHDTAHGREETMLMVYLRSHARAERAAGADTVMVDRHDMHDFAAGLRPDHATDVSGDRNRVERAIETLISDRLLLKPRPGDTDRLIVSPVVDVIMPIERLYELRNWLRTQNADPDHSDTEEVRTA